MAPYPRPPAELSSRYPIRFLHPGYQTPNRLLSLPRVDRVAGTTTYGVHYGTALLACQIIAGNAFNTGRLTLDQAGQHPVELLSEDILTEMVYYFIVGDGPGQYPVVPSFLDWEFPHNRIPDSWPQVSTTSSTDRCAISNFSFAVEAAHLVPKSEGLWYQKNDMGRYADAILSNIHNPINIAPLKADLHKCFDDRWFAIIPKVTETTTPCSPEYVTHILRQQAVEIWPMYHNITVQYLHAMARPYLFARFAWAILLQVKPFITAGVGRYVIRIPTNDEDKIEYKQEFLSGLELQKYYGGGGSQAATPVKRKSASAADEDGLVGSSSEDSDVDMDNDWENRVSEWQQQGKKRKQISSETTVEEENRERQLVDLKIHLKEIFPEDEDDIPQRG